MEQTGQHRETILRVPLGRIAISALTVGGLTVSVLAGGTAGATTTRATRSVVVSTIKNPKFGKILVSGKTLYTLKSSKTACSAQCLKVWPELVLPKGVKKATPGSGVRAAKLGTVKRSGGVLQVTYAGKPLYRFSGDTSTGQANGNVTDTWGKWSVVEITKPAHASIPAATTPTTIPTTSPTSGTSSTKAKSSPTTTSTTARAKTTVTSPPATTTTVTSPPATTTPATSPPATTTTTTTAPGGGGGVGF